MRKFAIAAAVAAATISTAALALVTFDSATGTGFVGKGDVQLAYGWNNKQLQDNAGGVSFVYDQTTSYEGVCTWTTGEGTRGERIHNVDHTTRTAVLSTVGYEARKNSSGKDGSITGFFLNGFGTTTSTGGSAPYVGGPCMGNPGNDAVWSSVSATGSTGGLFVVYGGASLLLQ
jgi:hypothetical protein